MSSQRNSGNFSKEAEDPYQTQNLSDDFGIGTRQDEAEDEAEWLRQHGDSGFSGFSGSNTVCILDRKCFLSAVWLRLVQVLK